MSNNNQSKQPQRTKLNSLLMSLPDIVELSVQDLTIMVGGGDTVVAPTRPTGGGGFINNHNEIFLSAE
jgi:hypothetical protein